MMNLKQNVNTEDILVGPHGGGTRWRPIEGEGEVIRMRGTRLLLRWDESWSISSSRTP